MLLETRAGWEGANSGPLVEVIASAVETRQVVIREVEVGTAGSHVTGEVETTGVVAREWVVQAFLQEGGPRTELAREVEEVEEADESLLRNLRALLLETLAGWEGMDSRPLVGAVASAVETRRVFIREVEGGTADSHVPREVKTKEVVTRELDVQAVLQEGGPLRSLE